MLPSHALEAFLTVAETRHFTRAASRLHLTQSALSQRILKLEEQLETSLLIRDPREVRLTPAGERLLRYARLQRGLEEEVLKELATPTAGSTEVQGTIRIGGFSSVMRSLILPKLAAGFKAHPQVNLDLRVAELRALEGQLRSGEVDLLLTYAPPAWDGVESVRIFTEENVLVEAAGLPTERRDLLFDHDPEDLTTEQFLKRQSKTFRQAQGLTTYRRGYLGDIYALRDAVEAGLGRAVLPRHLLLQERGRSTRLVETEGQTPVLEAVYLNRLESAYRPRLQSQAFDILSKK
jgi:DNA-binding transcriptional LysR family regulator